MIVKVCGLTPKTNLEALATNSIDWAGLIFVKESPRYVGKDVFSLPDNFKGVGVFRNELINEVLETVERWSLQAVQLHGNESPNDCALLKEAGLQVIKAISISDMASLDELTSPYLDHVDYFLFDSPGGGTGQAFDWGLLSGYKGQVPFLLAGGIAPGFGESIKTITHPQFAGIDLNSRFEIAPGHKDVSLLEKFLSDELSR